MVTRFTPLSTMFSELLLSQGYLDLRFCTKDLTLNQMTKYAGIIQDQGTVKLFTCKCC